MAEENVRKCNWSERSCQDQCEELSVILDSVPALVFCKDRENRFLWVNRVFCEAMGMPKEELEGRSVFDLFPREEADAYWQDDMKVMATGEPKRNILEPLPRAGEKLWLLTDKIPHRDKQGEIAGVIGFSVDITARKNADDSLRAAYAEEKRIRRENEQLVDQLKAALAKIRTLDSLLPVCAVCKKIRDENGVWQYMEAYISSRTETQFTHGYCPECAAKVERSMHPRSLVCDKCGSNLELLRYVNGGKRFRRYYCKECGYSQEFFREVVEE